MMRWKLEVPRALGRVRDIVIIWWINSTKVGEVVFGIRIPKKVRWRAVLPEEPSGGGGVKEGWIS